MGVIYIRLGDRAGRGRETAARAMSAAGPFSTGISGLSPGTTYYFRAKAVAGGAVYGSQVSFTTLQAVVSPAVTTNAGLAITGSSANLRGSLDNLGGSTAVNVSFQWGTTAGGPYPNETPPATMGTTGAYQSTISGLRPATSYYFRAKAAGNGTSYGVERSFATPAG